MCGRFTLDPDERFYPRFLVSKALTPILPRYNIAPMQQVPIIIDTEEGYIIKEMTWGLIPHWAKEKNIGYKMINARSETLSEKASFKNSYKNKRCLVPASGFYEWEKQGSKKIPHYFTKIDGDYLGMAGLYSSWNDPKTGQNLDTFTIITTQPNKLVGIVHNRMPAVLEPDSERIWLDHTIQETTMLENLLTPLPENEMKEHIVSTDVNSPRNEGKELITKVSLD